MESLVEKVLALESQAEEILNGARVRVKELEQQADIEAQKVFSAAEADLARRVQEARQNIEKHHAEEVAAARAAHAEALERTRQVPADIHARQVQLVVKRFREL